MKLTDWLKIRTKYVNRAKERVDERVGLGAAADEDIPYYAKVQDEMLMDLFERLAKIEELYKPAPDTVEHDDTRSGKIKPTNRLRLG